LYQEKARGGRHLVKMIQEKHQRKTKEEAARVQETDLSHLFPSVQIHEETDLGPELCRSSPEGRNSPMTLPSYYKFRVKRTMGHQKVPSLYCTIQRAVGALRG